jgi:hypothetical protein
MDMSTSTAVEYTDFLEAVIIKSVQYGHHHRWRVGQTAFNVLGQMRPDLAEQVRASDIDPFHADLSNTGHEKVAAFLAYVQEHW